MKTIDEIVDNLFENCSGDMSKNDAKRIAKDCVGLAQKWIPVDQEKPKIDESVLIKNSFGCYGVGKWDGKDWTFYTIEGVAKLSNWISKECTHWRPIELK